MPQKSPCEALMHRSLCPQQDGYWRLLHKVCQRTIGRRIGSTFALFSQPNDENLYFFVAGYAGELQAFAQAVRRNTPPHPSIADACAALQVIKSIEPQEVYVKESLRLPHWQSENFWLQVEE